MHPPRARAARHQAWRHVRHRGINLTPTREGTGPARLLDMVGGRTKHAFKTNSCEDPYLGWNSAARMLAARQFNKSN